MFTGVKWVCAGLSEARASRECSHSCSHYPKLSFKANLALRRSRRSFSLLHRSFPSWTGDPGWPPQLSLMSWWLCPFGQCSPPALACEVWVAATQTPKTWARGEASPLLCRRREMRPREVACSLKLEVTNQENQDSFQICFLFNDYVWPKQLA